MIRWYAGQKHDLLPGEKQGGEAFPCVEELSSRPGVNTTLLSSGNCSDITIQLLLKIS